MVLDPDADPVVDNKDSVVTQASLQNIRLENGERTDCLTWRFQMEDTANRGREILVRCREEGQF